MDRRKLAEFRVGDDSEETEEGDRLIRELIFDRFGWTEVCAEEQYLHILVKKAGVCIGKD